jgi:hypothetical protein
MPITNGYATLAQFKQRFLASAAVDGSRDADIELVIQAASRHIDQHCGRVFYSGIVGEVRYFTAVSRYRVFVDDMQAVTAVATDDDGDETYSTTWTAADYRLMPVNPLGWPYTWIEVKRLTENYFPRYTAAVKVTGTFGWAAVPDAVREACLLQANRTWARRNAPFGVMGSNDFGAPTVITKLDPDIQNLLAPFVRYT